MTELYFEGTTDTIYAQEQRAFAKMEDDMRLRKRKKRRRRAIMWVLRQL